MATAVLKSPQYLFTEPNLSPSQAPEGSEIYDNAVALLGVFIGLGLVAAVVFFWALSMYSPYCCGPPRRHRRRRRSNQDNNNIAMADLEGGRVRAEGRSLPHFEIADIFDIKTPEAAPHGRRGSRLPAPEEYAAFATNPFADPRQSLSSPPWTHPAGTADASQVPHGSQVTPYPCVFDVQQLYRNTMMSLALVSTRQPIKDKGKGKARATTVAASPPDGDDGPAPQLPDWLRDWLIDREPEPEPEPRGPRLSRFIEPDMEDIDVSTPDRWPVVSRSLKR